ncbi:MAG: glycosyltransferase, partial [Gammaproteobacteria bacterium]|nr:glycosyltransferase [Gammaproteobacteria bacterium]
MNQMLLKPRISVITINYNDGEYLEKTIKSVICQDYDAIEFIIIDGGSEDQSLKIAEKYKNNITIMLSEPDDG